MRPSEASNATAPDAGMPVADKAVARRERAKRSVRKLVLRAAHAARQAYAIDMKAANSGAGIDPVASSENWDGTGYTAFLVGIVLASLHGFDAEDAWRDAADAAAKVSYHAMALAGRSGEALCDQERNHAAARDAARTAFKRAIVAVRPELRAAPAA